MKNMKRKIFCSLFIFTLLSITACQGVNIGTLASSGIVVDALIHSGIPQGQVMSVDLNDEEISLLADAENEYFEFRAKWERVIDDPIFIAANILMLETDFIKLREAYTVWRAVVITHWQEYNPLVQQSFTNYARQAENIDQNIRQLIINSQANEAVNMALQYASLAAQLGVL